VSAESAESERSLASASEPWTWLTSVKHVVHVTDWACNPFDVHCLHYQTFHWKREILQST
jgi:hypothetical protein